MHIHELSYAYHNAKNQAVISLAYRVSGLVAGGQVLVYVVHSQSPNNPGFIL